MNYQNFDEMLIVQEIQILNLKSIKKKIVFNKESCKKHRQRRRKNFIFSVKKWSED